MPRPGWIKLYYSLLDNPIWEKEKPFTEAQAWIDILLLAAHEEHNSNGTVWNPGEVHISKNNLAKRWGWSRRRIDECFSRWETEHMVERTFEHAFERGSKTVLTVVNWGKFQGRKPKSERAFERTSVSEHKKIYKKGGDGGSSPRPAGEVEVVKINGEWVARQK